MEKETVKDKYILQSVANAFDIIDLLTKHEELSIQEIADEMKLSRSSVFRLLCTMESRYFVRRSEGTNYRLGLKLTDIGSVVHNRMEIVSVAHRHMCELAQAVSESVNLTIFDDDTHIRFADRVTISRSIPTQTWIGATLETHLSAGGKVLLSFSQPEVLEQYIAKAQFLPVTETSILTSAQLRAEVEQIRENGFAINNEEVEEGLYSVAVPIFGSEGVAIAALSVIGPVGRMKKNQEMIIPYLRQTAADISRDVCGNRYA